MLTSPIITRLTDTDLYKFTMQQTMLHRNPQAQALSEFVCRNAPDYPLAELARDVNEQIDHLVSLRFTGEELSYLAKRPYFKSDYIDFLEGFQLRRRHIEVSTDSGRLVIKAQGPLVRTTMFEIFVLSIVNELYFERFDQEAALSRGQALLERKIDHLRIVNTTGLQNLGPFEFFDFGTRRRFSRAWQDHVVQSLAREVPAHFKGTSNVHLAMKHNLTPIGTMAHEYLQMYQGLGVQLKNTQKAALEDWASEYRGDLGIALTDVINMDAFLRDFDLYFAKLFDGLRHDSGDPFVWGEKAIAHYQKLKIDPTSKRLVFSDGLDLGKAVALHQAFAGRIRCGFGIGTNLTNDVGLAPLNIVMKLMSVNQQPVAKISDAPGKTLCTNTVFLDYLRQVFLVENETKAPA